MDLDVAARLQSLLERDPPGSLRERVLVVVERTPQLPGPLAPSVEGRLPPPDRESGVVAGVIPRTGTGEQRVKVPRLLLVAAAAAAVVGGAWTLRFVEGPVVEESAVRPDVSSTRELTGLLDAELVAADLAGRRALLLEGRGFDQIAPDRAFALWAIDDGNATLIGLFRPDASGNVRVVFDGIETRDVALGVTEESAQGATAPTAPVLLQG